MARSSKKKQADTSAATKIYSVGIYARLSVDADVRKNESAGTQIEIAKEYVKRQKDMVIRECYTDIGKTGTNFEREAFERMMRDVRLRKIDCIIVKDLSRFGRNHIETGNYIEKIFPFMGVRFIAVTDNFDSMNISGQNETLGVNVKNLVNEMYAKDISVKVKSSRKAKWEQGSFTGGVPPYGYRAEWMGDKKCLFEEEITSDIVRKIFDLFVSGKSMKEIVIWLYGQGIVRPMEYHKSGKIFCEDREKLLQWSRESVKMILTNPVYTGCLVRGRSSEKHNVVQNRNDLVCADRGIKENTHTAIIGEDIFFKAAARFEKSSACCNKNGFSRKALMEEDIFADVLYCGDCGSKMKRISAIKVLSSKKRERTYSYNCPKYGRVDTERCVSKSISLQKLTDLVKTAIRQELLLSSMRLGELTDAADRETQALKQELGGRLNALDKRLESLNRLGSEQYLKYHMAQTDERTYRCEREKNAKKAASIQSMRTDISEQLRRVDAQNIQRKHFLRNLVKGDEKTELTGEVIRTLINRIEVYPDCRVKVIFAFQRKEIY